MDTLSLRISYKSTLSPFTAAGVYAYNNGGGYAEKCNEWAFTRGNVACCVAVLAVQHGNTKCRNAMCGFQPAQSISFESKHN